MEPGGTGSNGISTSGTFLATSNDYWNATGTNGADPITVTFGSYANNDPNFGVRLVSAYDSTGNVPNDYASAALGRAARPSSTTTTRATGASTT